MPPPMTRVRAPWATIVPVEMERGEVMVDGTPPSLLSPSETSAAGKSSCEPRAMNYTRGATRSEAQASMASGVRDTTLFKKSYRKHLKSINSGVGEIEGSRGRVSCSVPPQLSSATSSISQRVLLSPITSKSSMDDGERGRETTAFDAATTPGYMDEGRSKGKRVRGLGGAVYRGATVPLTTSNEPATNASALQPSTGPVPDETSSRANRITQNSRYLKNSNKLADNIKPPSNTIGGNVGENILWGGTNGDPSSLSSYHSSPRERKRLQHEAAVAEGLLWGTDVQTTAVISGGIESSGPRGERQQQSRHAPSVPPNTKVAARLALLARLNDSSVARNAAEAAAARGVVVGKSGDGAVNSLLNRKLDQWSKEYVDGRAGFPSTWASDRHIIPYSTPKDEDVGRSSSPQRIHSKAACLPQGDVVPLLLPSNTRSQSSPISCLPSGDDAAPQRATGKATNITASSVSTRKDQQHAFPPRHDNERHGKSTRKLIPAQVHSLSSAEGGRYFLAPEPSSFPRRKGGQQQELCNSGGGGASPDNRVMMAVRGGGANKIKVAVSPDGRYLSPSPHSKSSRSKSKNSRSSKLGGFSVGSSSYVPPPPSPPTLSMATENVVVSRVHTLLKDSAESLLQHKELMQTLARWNDRNNSSEGDNGGGGGYQ